jgi:hypothetical protein
MTGAADIDPGKTAAPVLTMSAGAAALALFPYAASLITAARLRKGR